MKVKPVLKVCQFCQKGPEIPAYKKYHTACVDYVVEARNKNLNYQEMKKIYKELP